jgi:multidrug efflux pump
LNQDEARQLELSSAAVAEFINAAVTGIPATQVRDSIYLIDVVARAEASERMSLETIRALKVPLSESCQLEKPIHQKQLQIWLQR